MNGIIYLVGLVVVSIAQFQLYMAAIPLATDVGRLCGFNLFHCVSSFLVHGADS